MYTRKTKIVCSLGPTSDSDEVVEKLILSGMNVARFNFSHGTHDEQRSKMERVKRCSKKLNKPVALLLDTKGPEIRTGNTQGGEKVAFNEGDTVIVTVDDAITSAATKDSPGRIALNWLDFPKKAKKGVRVLIADGLLELLVERNDGNEVFCTVKNNAEIGSKKNVNILGVHAGLPIMTETDKKDIEFGISMGVDFIAASFVSFASEVVEIREFIHSFGSKAHIIAKIENEEGLDNITEIIEAADGVMVARGDLGVQLPTERIPLAQKQIILECLKAGKPVITATQMLESMIVNPRPTRAELTDVANAILDGTDAVMLSGETANGSYPVEAVETLNRIAVCVEESSEFRKKMREHKAVLVRENMSQIVAHSAYGTATEIEASAMVTPTLGGNTARMLSMFRPEQPILGITPNEQVLRQLQLSWGVFPFLSTMAEDSESMIQNSVKIAIDNQAVQLGDRIVLCAGIPLSSPVMTNTVRILVVGNILARGCAGGSATEDHTRVTGRVVRAQSADDALHALRKNRGEVLVCPDITEEYIPLLRIVDGVICEGENLIPPEVIGLINPNLVWLSRVGSAAKALESGLTITVDTVELLVYEGMV